jgi:uncharacterized protein (UPF0218 family)
MLHKLPLSLRKDFAKPMGPLFEGDPTISLPKAIVWIRQKQPCFLSTSPPRLAVICVGDIISKGMLQNPILSPHLKFCFIDGETQRGTEIIAEKPAGMQTLTMKNPRGMVSDELIAFIKSKWQDTNQYLVQIDGEEDLLVIPAVLECDKSLVFYGQPPTTDAGNAIPAGCVGLYSDPTLRKTLQSLFDQFEKLE